jgi:hypothetical protein
MALGRPIHKEHKLIMKMYLSRVQKAEGVWQNPQKKEILKL